jgi:hypothetical protein
MRASSGRRSRAAPWRSRAPDARRFSACAAPRGAA